MSVEMRPAQPATRDPAPLVHDHAWSLVAVDFSDGPPVREFACSGCPAVWFR